MQYARSQELTLETGASGTGWRGCGHRQQGRSDRQAGQGGVQGFSRKPGAWSGLPKAEADWVTPATNAAIADALTVSEMP